MLETVADGAKYSPCQSCWVFLRSQLDCILLCYVPLYISSQSTNTYLPPTLMFNVFISSPGALQDHFSLFSLRMNTSVTHNASICVSAVLGGQCACCCSLLRHRELWKHVHANQGQFDPEESVSHLYGLDKGAEPVAVHCVCMLLLSTDIFTLVETEQTDVWNSVFAILQN